MCALTWQWLHEDLAQLKEKSQFRQLVNAQPLSQGWTIYQGKKMLDLASNHYLGLEQNLHINQLTEAMQSLLGQNDTFRIASTASRLVVGNDPIFQRFEERFATFKETESCLLFSNGYMANLGVISALMSRGDYVFSDRLNHASIVDGITLSRAEHYRYPHRDLNRLEHMLQKVPLSSKKLIVTDALFSMDGTFAPLQDLVTLKKKYHAILMVDEAHSGGVCSKQGQGLVHALGLTPDVDIQMGTFSKAYGCYGAYVVADAIVKDYLVNKARSLIYTTALPPLVIMQTYYNWMQVRDSVDKRAYLRELAQGFRSALQSKGLSIGESESQIVPILIGQNETTLAFAERLQLRGIIAVPIRPPTVPENTARIRFTLTAAHQQSDIEWAVNQIHEVAMELGIC
jgi:8-amino-7-oxononanoate synthase